MQITEQYSRRIPKQFDGEQEKSMTSIDRLPDDILVPILSFLPTRCCVRSSILAKKWRFLWALVPNLDFDSEEHKTVKSFSEFFHRFVFIHNGQSINRFRFQSTNYRKDSKFKFEIEKWVATAIACNVQVINIFLDHGLMLPQCIFTCKTLVYLTLNSFPENNDPMTGTIVYLPALKKLELMGVKYESEESLAHLLSGCPVLEELTIIKEDADVRCLFVSSPTLTRLDLEIEFDDVEDDVFEVKLDTPALKYLRLHDCLSKDFSAGMFALLTEADVLFEAHTDRDAEMDVLYCRSVLEFVGKLNNVNSLKLTTGLMEVPESAFAALTTEFRVLTKLELDGDLRFVTKFLENSDNLKVLTIRMVNDAKYWMEPKQVPVCMISHLGKVRFYNFKCSELEFNMVRYILRNSKVLKKMVISSNCYDHHGNLIDWKKKFEALKRISLFERASEACQLVFD